MFFFNIIFKSNSFSIRETPIKVRGNALYYILSQNIAHCDTKIDNLLSDSNNDLKLIDYGLLTKYKDDEFLKQPCGTMV